MYLDKAARAISTSCDIDEISQIRQKAEALRVYAGRCSEMGRKCGIIRLRAERRIGEILDKSVRRGNPNLQRSQPATIGKLDDLGITKSESSRWQASATLPMEKFEQYVETAREPSTAGVLSLVREHEREQAAADGPKAGGNIFTAPASSLDRLDANSVDLFFSDPPYKAIDCYEQMAKLASSKLKDGRLCLAYAGIKFLPDVLDVMRNHLDYRWMFAVEFAGTDSMVFPLQIKNGWQAIVVFGKGKQAKHDWITDHLHSGGREKSGHKFQKTSTDICAIIERLTKPGDLVVDPFAGSGSIPSACKQLGRRWIATQIDAGTARAARRRVA